MATGIGGATLSKTPQSDPWETYRRKLMLAQGVDASGQFSIGSGDPNTLRGGFNPAQGIDPTRQLPVAQPAIVPTHTNPAVSGPSNTSPVKQASAATTSQQADGWETIPGGRYYSGYTGSTIGKLAGDPETAAREWAKYTTTGGSPYARYMSSVFSDPMAILRAQGVDPGALDEAGVSRLNQFGHLWDRLSGRHTENGLNMTADPRAMLGNIFNAEYDKGGKATDLGHLVDNPDLLPEEQVKNTVGLILSALQGFVSDEALNAYSAMINEFAQDWLSERNQNPDKWDSSVTFKDAIKARFGSGGGLL